MRFVDEYRDPAAARAFVARITELAGDGSYKFMEVCGGHTHTIYRHGIEHVLPISVELVHGPGCPVCVIPMGRIDDAIAVAEAPGVIFTSFGDMMRVPGSNGNLLGAKARGADVRFVYSPLDALRIAADNPDRQVVFFAVGFETTAPSTAATLLRARADAVVNFTVFSNHVTIVPPDQGDPRVARPAPRRLSRPRSRLDGGRPATVPFRARGVRQAPRYRRLRAARHPAGDRDAAGADQRGPVLCREPVHALRQRGGEPQGARHLERGVRAPTALRVARSRVHLPERAQAQGGVRRRWTRSFASRCRASASPTRRPASAARC